MSDILIKNMKLPKKGCFLFQISANGDVWVSNRNDEGTGIIIAKAIEVPPHGELVERSWLRGEIGNAFLDAGGFLNPNSEMYSPLVSKICDAVVNAPTILEASE